MNLYVELCIEDVDEDADIQKIARIIAEQVQDKQPFHTITVNAVEAV